MSDVDGHELGVVIHDVLHCELDGMAVGGFSGLRQRVKQRIGERGEEHQPRSEEDTAPDMGTHGHRMPQKVEMTMPGGFNAVSVLVESHGAGNRCHYLVSRRCRQRHSKLRLYDSAILELANSS